MDGARFWRSAFVFFEFFVAPWFGRQDRDFQNRRNEHKQVPARVPEATFTGL